LRLIKEIEKRMREREGERERGGRKERKEKRVREKEGRREGTEGERERES